MADNTITLSGFYFANIIFKKPVFGDSNKIRIFFGQFLHLFEHVVLSGIDVNVEIVSSVEQSFDETL